MTTTGLSLRNVGFVGGGFVGGGRSLNLTATGVSAFGSFGAHPQTITNPADVPEKPATVTEGSLLLWWAACSQGRPYTFPSGFTQILVDNQATTSSVLGWKRATSSEPASYTGSYDADEPGGAFLAVVAGAPDLDPSFYSSSFSGNIEDEVVTHPGFTLPRNGLVLMAGFRRDFPGDTNARTTDAPMEVFQSFGSFPSGGLVAGEFSAGATGTLSIRNLAVEQNAGGTAQAIALF